MCRPGHASSRGPSTGGHMGPPLRGVEGIPNQRKIGAKTDLANGAGRSRAVRPERRGVVTPPYGCNDGGAKRRANVGIGPYGKPDQPPKPAGAQRSVRARGREGWAGIGAKAIPKGGPPPRPPRQRLAKRKARKEQLVKFRFCPTTSECSTAYKVRKSQPGPARALAGAASTEQNGLGPHPAAREGAPRP